MQKRLGSFILKEQIGQGGMGQVYKSFDEKNKREVAVKIIKPNLLKNPISKKRFLQEAFIHAQLSHPAILPIHSIEIHDNGIGYSMPLLVGQTLKSYLMDLKKDPTLLPLKERLRHFMKILEACSYTHKMGFIHRDIKADNIFIGRFQQTLLFDWGLACPIHSTDEIDQEELITNDDLTRPGKIPGTLTHLAPERAFGVKGSIGSDIFSLGVVLYQLLTLKMPFFRKDLDHFKSIAGKETYLLASEVNPKEDIDEGLDLIVAKALENDPQKRYQDCEEFIEDLKKILDGLPIWKQPMLLSIHEPKDWLFQDLLPIGEYIALSQKSLNWGILFVPNEELIDNYRLKLVTKNLKSSFKIYLNLSKTDKRFDLEQAYILDIDPKHGIALYQYFALLEQKNIDCGDHELCIEIEKIENHFQIKVNKQLYFCFHSRLPILSPHVGLLIEDEGLNFEMIALSKASSSKQTSCLKLGDNLVFHQNFDAARLEYQKIFQSFKQHEEGREALFRQGFSYILEAQKKSKNKKKLFENAIAVFEKFKEQKAKPWEYWGKALTYEAMQQPQEMIKCFEMAFRKYPHHPFTQELRQELLVLFFEKSIKAKKEALSLSFVALRYLDDNLFMNAFPDLIDSLEEELQESFCLFDPLELTRKQRLILTLSVVLKQESFLLESIVKSQDVIYNENAFCALIHINSKKITQSLIKKLKLEDPFNALFKDEPCPYIKRHLRYAFFGYKLFKSKPILDFSSNDVKENFIIGINHFLNGILDLESLQLDCYSKHILELFQTTYGLDLEEMKKKLKGPFFQKAEHFIKSNFLISLLEKKPIDYFGFDKYALEFAIKGLFLRKLNP